VLASCGSTSTTTITTSTAPTTSVTTSAPTTSAQTPSAVVFQGVVGPGAQRPRSLELTGDGTLAVTGVQWSSWGGPAATGSGNAEYHGCTPNCAAAPVHMAFVSIRLFGIRRCAGRQYYSAVALRLNSGRLLDRQFLQRSWSPC
jgi:hypothetical protein